MRLMDPDQAVELIQSESRVYVHEAAMVPTSLVSALVRRAPHVQDVEVVHLHTEAPAPYVDPALAGHLRHNALFVGANVREAVNDGRADYTPVFLSEVPLLMADATLPIDVALVQMSPPDRHGFCRLGVSVACARAAVDNARVVIAEFNPRVPRTLGNSALHVRGITAAVEVDRPLPSRPPEPFGPIEQAIGRHVANLIPDGATIQIGIGIIPNAVLAALHNHQDLGVHTEMFTDGLIDLIDAGVVTNRVKSRFHGRVITSFALGTQRLYDFVDDNPFVEFHPTNIVNDPFEIRQQFTMVAINSAIQIDLTGQVCADSIGQRVYSGIGGQMDFVQGALRSPNGKAIIALPSTARGGTVSRIVSCLTPGSGVVTTRGHVQWVVTEFGAVNLRGKNLRQRAELLISIAHPAFRSELQAAAVKQKILPVTA